MPKGPIDYSSACVYQICCKDAEIKDVYVGSTNNLIKRRCCHKSDCHNESCKNYNLPVYQFIRDHGGWDNWEVVKVEDTPVTCREDLLKFERACFQRLGATLNKLVPGRSQKEAQKIYYETNRDKCREKGKQYYEANRDKIAERHRAHYQANKESITEKHRAYHEANKERRAEKNKQWREANKTEILEKKKLYREANKTEIAEKMKDYYETNRDKCREKMKDYYETNKTEILEKSREKVTCICGSVVCKSSMSKHCKTKKHQSYLESLE